MALVAQPCATETKKKPRGTCPRGFFHRVVTRVRQGGYALGVTGSPIGVVGSACASLRSSSKRIVLR